MKKNKVLVELQKQTDFSYEDCEAIFNWTKSYDSILRINYLCNRYNLDFFDVTITLYKKEFYNKEGKKMDKTTNFKNLDDRNVSIKPEYIRFKIFLFNCRQCLIDFFAKAKKDNLDCVCFFEQNENLEESVYIFSNFISAGEKKFFYEYDIVFNIFNDIALTSIIDIIFNNLKKEQYKEFIKYCNKIYENNK